MRSSIVITSISTLLIAADIIGVANLISWRQPALSISGKGTTTAQQPVSPPLPADTKPYQLQKHELPEVGAQGLNKDDKGAQQGLDLIASMARGKQPLSPEEKIYLKEIKTKTARLFEQKQYASAQNELTRALEKLPNDADLAYELSRSMYFQHEYAQSLKIVNDLLLKLPGNIDYLDLRGRIYLADNNLKQAEKDFRTALKQDKSNSEAIDGLEQISEIVSAWEKSEKIIQKRDFIQKQWGLADGLEKSGDFLSVIPIYKQIVNRYPDDLESQMKLGRALMLSKFTDEAERLYTTLLETQTRNKALVLARAHLYLNTGELDLAGADLRWAKAIAPGDREVESDIKLLNERIKQAETIKRISQEWGKADKLKNRGMYPDAITIYKNILKLYPENLDTQVRLAWVLRADGQPVKARAIYEKLLKGNPDNSDLWVGLGYTFFDENLFAEAEKRFSTAQKYLSGNARAELDFIIKKMQSLRIQSEATTRAISLPEPL